MKAIQILGPGVFDLCEVPTKPLSPTAVRIAIRATTLCGSDLKNLANPIITPQVIGHEFAGDLLEIGASVPQKIMLGTRVTAFPMQACLACHVCQAGAYRDCTGKRSLGFQLPGSFAEMVDIHYRFIVPLPPGMSHAEGTLIEHLACGYRVAEEVKQLGIDRRERILVVGDGPIALADLQALNVAGFTAVDLLGKHPRRLAAARELGAVLACARPEELNTNSTYAACLYAAPAPSTLSALLPLLRRGAFLFPQTRVEGNELLSALDAHPIRYGRAFAYEIEDFYTVAKMMVNGKLNTKRLVTHRLSLFDVFGLRAAIANRSKEIKILLTPTIS